MAGMVASEIQEWIDREAIARLVTGEIQAWVDPEARLLSAGGGFDPQLQSTLLRHGVFPAVEATAPGSGTPPWAEPRRVDTGDAGGDNVLKAR